MRCPRFCGSGARSRAASRPRRSRRARTCRLATLKWSSDTPYKTTSFDIIRVWDWKHEQPGARFPQRVPYVAGDLALAMRENPKLQVLSANGYFDLATPFFATESDLSHMQLDPSLRGNLEFRYYPSGHMVYLNVDALKRFKGDLDAFYERAVGAQRR